MTNSRTTGPPPPLPSALTRVSTAAMQCQNPLVYEYTHHHGNSSLHSSSCCVQLQSGNNSEYTLTLSAHLITLLCYLAQYLSQISAALAVSETWRTVGRVPFLCQEVCVRCKRQRYFTVSIPSMCALVVHCETFCVFIANDALTVGYRRWLVSTEYCQTRWTNN